MQALHACQSSTSWRVLSLAMRVLSQIDTETQAILEAMLT